MRPRSLYALAAVLCALRAGAQPSDAQVFDLRVQLSALDPSSPLAPWVDGGLGKLRYAESDRGIEASRLYAAYTGRLGPVWTVHVGGDVVADADAGLGITEAFFERRAIPRSPNRTQWKLGFFHPPWSLENTDPGWTAPLTLSPSALNAWIGEEVRPFGGQWTLQRRIGGAGSSQQAAFHAAGFVGNDPAGSLLVWKGWSVHDRQSRLGDELPLAPLPQLQPGAMFAKQSPYVAPWREVDGRVGYYAGADWRYGRRALVALAHYDNRADPLEIERGQYAWHTHFDQIGTQVDLGRGFALLAQRLEGRTAMGPVLGPARAVDADFGARYVLLTKLVARHRVTARYETFDVHDRDIVPNDDNTDAGRALTVAYRFAGGERWSFGSQWLEVTSRHPARAYFGDPEQVTERLFEIQATLRLRRD